MTDSEDEQREWALVLNDGSIEFVSDDRAEVEAARSDFVGSAVAHRTGNGPWIMDPPEANHGDNGDDSDDR